LGPHETSVSLNSWSETIKIHLLRMVLESTINVIRVHFLVGRCDIFAGELSHIHTEWTDALGLQHGTRRLHEVICGRLERQTSGRLSEDGEWSLETTFGSEAPVVLLAINPMAWLRGTTRLKCSAGLCCLLNLCQSASKRHIYMPYSKAKIVKMANPGDLMSFVAR